MENLSEELKKVYPIESQESTAKQEKSQKESESNDNKKTANEQDPYVAYDVRLSQLKKSLDKEGVCVCEGQKWVGFKFPVGHDDFGRLTPCVCSDSTENRKQILVKASRLPEEKGFSDYWVSWNSGCNRGYEKCIDWSQGEDEPFVTLIGNTGVGKTHLAIASGWALIGRGLPVLFYQSSDLMHDLQNGMGREDRDFERRLNQVKQCQNLILDDVGREYSTDWTLSILHELIDYRYSNASLRTLITTNHSLAELRSIIGEPAVSRLTDSYHGTLVVMDGRDIRPRLSGLKDVKK